MGVVSFRAAVAGYLVAVSPALLLYSGPAAADVGSGVYVAVGGVGFERNVCWRYQKLENGRWTGHDYDRPETSPDLLDEALKNENVTYTGAVGDRNVIYVRGKQNRKLYGRFIAVPCPPPEPPKPPPPPSHNTVVNLNGGFLGGGVVETSSKTTAKSPVDKQTKGDPTTQAIIFGEFDYGSWFVTGQMTFAGKPHGNFSDVFPAFPAANFTANVNSGQLYGFVADGGYTVYNSGGLKVGIFGGYYVYDEFDYGMFPGFAATFPIMATQWRAGEGGVSIDKMFQIGAEPFDLNVTAAGLYDHLRSGLFSGNGGGARINGRLSFPIGPVTGNIIAQYTDLNASSSNTGVPLTFRTQTWYAGAGISYTFGGPPATAPASMVFKAPSK
jgi:hypothetical protein